jgi:hypothetical protein
MDVIKKYLYSKASRTARGFSEKEFPLYYAPLDPTFEGGAKRGTCRSSMACGPRIPTEKRAEDAKMAYVNTINLTFPTNLVQRP